MGINGLKAVGGGIAFHVGGYDSQARTFFYAPGPAQGVLKVFQLPKISLRPEPWVPASAVSYQSISWDLDAAYGAINELANMLQPGLLDALQQQLAGPNGGEGLNFQKDIFGPIGDRITVISDFKKTAKAEPKDDLDDDQRTLFAVALEDPKGFQNTLNKVMAMAQLSPKKREFQGTTIYDFAVNMPNAGAGQPKADMKGTLSVAVARDHCFVATEPTLLEQVLRAGGPKLADSPEFQAVAKEIPAQTSTLSYARPEEGARELYEMVKSGKLQEALEKAKANAGNDAEVPKLGDLIDKDKLPEFSLISKYLSSSGGYGVTSDDGFLSTTFTLLKANP
jgi:hypothetical protein